MANRPRGCLGVVSCFARAMNCVSRPRPEPTLEKEPTKSEREREKERETGCVGERQPHLFFNSTPRSPFPPAPSSSSVRTHPRSLTERPRPVSLVAHDRLIRCVPDGRARRGRRREGE